MKRGVATDIVRLGRRLLGGGCGAAAVGRRLWGGGCGAAAVGRRLWDGACGTAAVWRRLWGGKAQRIPAMVDNGRPRRTATWRCHHGGMRFAFPPYIVPAEKIPRSQAQLSAMASAARSTTPTQKKKPWFMPSQREVTAGTPASRSRAA